MEEGVAFRAKSNPSQEPESQTQALPKVTLLYKSLSDSAGAS